METNWSLKELYPSFESLEFIADVETLDKVITKYLSFAKSLSDNPFNKTQTLETYLNLQTEISQLFEKLFAYCSLTLSTNTSDATALKYSDILNEKASSLAESETKIQHFIGQLDPLDEVIEGSAKLKEHQFLFHEIKEFNQYLLSDKEEAIIAKMRNTGSNAWAKLKDILTSKLQVTVTLDGKVEQVPLTKARNLAHDPRSEVRKMAYEAELKAYHDVEDSLAACLNGIKGEVLTTCKLRGYEAPLQESLLHSRMDQATLEAMLEAMVESLPKFREFLKLKASLLGHTNGLPWYDLFAPMGKTHTKYEYPAGCEFVIKQFSTFSSSLANYAKQAMESSWIDVYPKTGKVGGAFCSNLRSIHQSRFLLNYGDQFNDVITLAHELGHGFHGHCLDQESILNAQYPMPLAETASTFCETIIKKAAIQSGTEEEAFSILEQELTDATQIIVDIYSRYLFESKLFKQREISALSSEELCKLMTESQLEAYGDGLDSNDLHPYMWANKPHYYYAGANFYNFPYAFGLLFAKGLYAEILEKGESFTKSYEDLLALTGKNTIADVAATVNIDVTSKAFWKQSLQTIIEDIETFKQLVNSI